jgi:hypothetical protein
MSATSAATPERKAYTSPLLRSYGSIVATTRGSISANNDAGGKGPGKG